MKETVRILIPEDKVDERIAQLGAQICILRGAVFFMCELAKRISVPVTLDFMSVSSYGSGTKSNGIVKMIKDLDEPIEGKDVLIVEDIIDSGRTLSYLLKNLSSRKPASIRLCTMLDKPERREVDVEVDYQGFIIPDEFVVGYGLDYDQRYRNLPYIGVLSLTSRIPFESSGPEGRSSFDYGT